MLKICVCSDNHGDIESINKIKQDNIDCDYYFHLGDSNLSPEELKPFITVKGNNDYDNSLDKQKIIEIAGYRFLLIHGTGYTYSLDSLYEKAFKEKANVLLFGHTHSFLDKTYKGIRMINPGSCFYNRDLTNPCYAILTIDEFSNINVKRIDII